jgi:hypothetical protein
VLWDGAGDSQFVDPEDGVTVLIPNGGGLESQASLPLFNPVYPRVENETFPFDLPTLLPEPSLPALLLAGVTSLLGLRRYARAGGR